MLHDLRTRLHATRWPDQIGQPWEYGTDLTYLKDLCTTWADTFDWHAQQARINEFANYRATIDGLGLHFIHERGSGPAPIPLLVLHGWPGDVTQMLDIIPPLTDPRRHGGDDADSFDVVAVSLPGYGFSDRPTAPGMSVAAMAALVHTLMTDVLGYAAYATRSSDLGAGITTELALQHPEAIIGMHTGGTNPWLADIPDNLTGAEQAFVAAAQQWNQQEMAYAQLHASRPQTLATALTDSPAGLASWLVEKYWRWTDHDGDLEQALTRDQILTHLTIYWATATAGSSMRLYAETVRHPGAWGRPDVPTAMFMCPGDMFPTPREWAERSTRIDRWTEAPRGGHFPEQEVPELVVADLRAFFAAMR